MAGLKNQNKAQYHLIIQKLSEILELRKNVISIFPTILPINSDYQFTDTKGRGLIFEIFGLMSEIIRISYNLKNNPNIDTLCDFISKSPALCKSLEQAITKFKEKNIRF